VFLGNPHLIQYSTVKTADYKKDTKKSQKNHKKDTKKFLHEIPCKIFILTIKIFRVKNTKKSQKNHTKNHKKIQKLQKKFLHGIPC
jgi:hypothetical protein